MRRCCNRDYWTVSKRRFNGITKWYLQGLFFVHRLCEWESPTRGIVSLLKNQVRRTNLSSSSTGRLDYPRFYCRSYNADFPNNGKNWESSWLDLNRAGEDEGSGVEMKYWFNFSIINRKLIDGELIVRFSACGRHYRLRFFEKLII